jgi:hypothetical protein
MTSYVTKIQVPYATLREDYQAFAISNSNSQTAQAKLPMVLTATNQLLQSPLYYQVVHQSLQTKFKQPINGALHLMETFVHSMINLLNSESIVKLRMDSTASETMVQIAMLPLVIYVLQVIESTWTLWPIAHHWMELLVSVTRVSFVDRERVNIV